MDIEIHKWRCLKMCGKIRRVFRLYHKEAKEVEKSGADFNIEFLPVMEYNDNLRDRKKGKGDFSEKPGNA